MHVRAQCLDWSLTYGIIDVSHLGLHVWLDAPAIVDAPAVVRAAQAAYRAHSRGRGRGTFRRAGRGPAMDLRGARDVVAFNNHARLIFT